MHTEHEVKLLGIDIEKVRKRLAALGAKPLGVKRFLRNTYDVEEGAKHKWLRLRTDGKQTTLTLKEIVHEGVDGTKETEVAVEDFAAAEKLLRLLGHEPKNVQENMRESYLLDGAAVEIDTWPGIPSYLEVEGRSEEEVRRIVERLGFFWSDATTMNTYRVYKQYGKDITGVKNLRL